MAETLRAPQAGWQPLIERALAALVGGPIEPGAVWLDEARRLASLEALSSLLDLVVLWNQHVDLTAARTPEELVDLYLIDALVLARGAAPALGERWIDVGSGAGAPGLVLQLLRPELGLTLVEPRSKRVAFLGTAIGQLRLRAKVVAARSDTLPASSCDVAVSRATFPPAEWLAEGTRLAKRSVWVLLARAEAPQASGWQPAEEVAYEWPLTGAGRRALRYTRSAAAGEAP